MMPRNELLERQKQRESEAYTKGYKDGMDAQSSYAGTYRAALESIAYQMSDDGFNSESASVLRATVKGIAERALAKDPAGENDVDGDHQRSDALPDAQTAPAGHREQDGAATVVTAGETAIPCPLRGPSGCSDSRHCANEPYCAGLRRASAGGADAPLTERQAHLIALLDDPRRHGCEQLQAEGKCQRECDCGHVAWWQEERDARTAIRPQMSGIEEGPVEIAIWAGEDFEDFIAQVSGPRERAIAEARHYALPCVADGQAVLIEEVTRTTIETIRPEIGRLP